MKRLFARQRVLFLLFSVPAFAVLGLCFAVPMQPSQQVEITPPGALSTMALPGTGDLQLIIQLSSPSLVEHIWEQEGQTPAPSFEKRKVDFQSSQTQSHRSRLAREHQEMLEQLSRVQNLRTEGTLDTVMNAVIARVPVERYSEVAKIPGIKKIYFSRPQQLLLDAAAVALNAQDLWTREGGRDNAGSGIKIGIIDTGIDITNPMFADTTSDVPPGYPKGESAFTNHKVIVARNYIDLLPSLQDVQTATDEVGHGTFVAGAAAGKVVTAPAATISGMAPGAFLGSYKVFGTPGINNSTTSAAVLAAINDAVADGMDVINLSLGSVDYAPPSEDVESLALENAIRLGIVVTVAAGDAGPSFRTISTPATAPDVIAVGSVSNTRALYAHIHATAPDPVPANLAGVSYLPGDGPKVTSNIASTGIVDVAIIDGNGLACSSLPGGSMNRQIALVSRGGTACSFATKVTNAAAAGAVAVVIYNNDPAGGIISIGGLGSTKIPAVAISYSDGLSLKQFIDANPGSAAVSIDNYLLLTATAVTGGVVSSFSSVGPSTDFIIKPDLVAVGENVYSAVESTSSKGVLYSPNGFAAASGTSFSAPMVAGAAACLKELHPELSALAIKSLLVNTAGQNVTSGSNAASILQMGSGLMNMSAALAAGAAFAPASVSFGTQSYSGSLSLTRSLSIANTSPLADQYILSISPLIAGPIVTLSQTYTGQVLPGQTTSINIGLQIWAPLSGGFAGFIVVQSTNTSTVYHIPYWAGLYAPDSSRVLSVSQIKGSLAYGSVTAALSAARPGNVIEIADSGTYSEGLFVNTNNEGLPLHGITIRAQLGKQPILDASAVSSASIEVVGLQNVLLQGLKVRGGPFAVVVWQPNSAFPASTTIDRCTITNVAGSGTSAVGVYSEGATVNVAKSDISGSTGTGIVANVGSYLTVSDTTVQNNANGGIDGFSSNVDILDSTISGNKGPGLSLYSCTGTVKGSSFSGNTGTSGDGAEINGGTVRISQNTFSSNARMGIGFFISPYSGLGATLTFTGNTVAGNKQYGIYASAAQNATLDGNMIKDNLTGALLTGTTNALLVNNIVTRSNGLTTGDGLKITGMSNIKIVNNTIYKNSHYGIVLSPLGKVSVINTIISANSAGDLQGMQATDVSFSLSGSSSFANVNNNISGDPGFANPDLDDFSLTANSPALNSGSNQASNLPFLDYYGHLRMAGSNVDMGAIEANSSFPLAIPVLANGGQILWNGGLQTAFSIYNTGNADASAGFAPYASTGAPLGMGNTTAIVPISSGSAVPIMGGQLFNFSPDQNVLGSVLISGNQPMAGFSLLTDSTLQRFATAVNASNQASTELLFPYYRNDTSRYVKYILFNPEPDAASVQAQLYSSSGSQLSSLSVNIAAKGQVILAFDPIYTSPSGYVHVQSSRPLTGIELLGDPEKLIALAGQLKGSESRLFFPFFSLNQFYSTLVGIVNPAAVTANVVLTAYDRSGRQLGDAVSLSLDPNAQILQTVSQLFGITVSPGATGYIVANGDQPGITGFIELDFSNTVHSAAAIPADSVPHKKLVFSHVASQVPSSSGIPWETGLVLMNPIAAAVQYTVSVYDGSGALIATTTGELAAGEMTARMLSHPAAGTGFFTQPMQLGSGHIEILSDHGLFGLEALFTDDISLMILTTPQKTEE